MASQLILTACCQNKVNYVTTISGGYLDWGKNQNKEEVLDESEENIRQHMNRVLPEDLHNIRHGSVVVLDLEYPEIYTTEYLREAPRIATAINRRIYVAKEQWPGCMIGIYPYPALYQHKLLLPMNLTKVVSYVTIAETLETSFFIMGATNGYHHGAFSASRHLEYIRRCKVTLDACGFINTCIYLRWVDDDGNDIPVSILVKQVLKAQEVGFQVVAFWAPHTIEVDRLRNLYNMIEDISNIRIIQYV